ncbi:hypothetical protein JCM8097_001988 [Rhodosporidiobolus ruineniae]
MSTRVAHAATTTSTSRRAAYQPTATTTARYPQQQYRRDPNPVQYTVERVRGNDGTEQEVLTLEDTPEPSAAAAAAAAQPVAGPSNGAAYASTSSARRDPCGGYEPAPKKRKSDVGAGGYAAAPQYAQAYPAQQAYSAQQGYRPPPAASGSGTKRKADDYTADHRSAHKQKEQPASKYSDAEGHFIVRIGEVVTNTRHKKTYEIKKQLGQGTFGKVVSAVERPSGKKVALKIIRNVHKYQEAAKTEIRVLSKLSINDPDGSKKCIKLDSSFDFFGHTCLVTPLLSCSVFDFLKENNYEPFPLSHVQSFARQLLTSLAYVHGNAMIHTDLKPENILLEDNTSDEIPGKRGKPRKILRNTGIQLIDFGSATFENDYHATVVSTRHYRAPEIILGMGWSYACDMWSIGCILVEFITGEALFQTHENLEHLAMMERVFGPMPADYARAATRVCPTASEWFKRGTAPSGSRGRSSSSQAPYVLNFPQASTAKSSTKFVRGMRSLDEIIKKYAGNEMAAAQFSDLCSGLLQWDVKKRSTVQQALKHPFFSTSIVDEGNPRRQ